MNDEDWYADALGRAVEAAPGRLAEPIQAFSGRKVQGGLAVLRSEGVTGEVMVRRTKGERNVLFCGFESTFYGQAGLRIGITGSNNVIFIGPHAAIGGVDLNIIGDGHVFYIGAFTTVGRPVQELQTALMCNQVGEGGRIVFGDQCMLATRVMVSNEDGHSIYDRATGERINPNADVFVDDHVSIGHDVRINKGTRIERDVIVQDGSVVAKRLEEGCVYGGVPARKVHEGVTWSRLDLESLDEVTSSRLHAEHRHRLERLQQRIADPAFAPSLAQAS